MRSPLALPIERSHSQLAQSVPQMFASFEGEIPDFLEKSGI
jgi:hypothetical protein